MRGAWRLLGLGSWVLLLLLGGGLVFSRLHPSGDLRSFMPPPVTPAQHIVMDQLGDGPGSRLLMLAIGGVGEHQAAALSKALARRLAGHPAYTEVLNGTPDISTVAGRLLPYRYLLLPEAQGVARLTSSALRDQLAERVDDLSSPAASLIEPWLPRDPTLAIAALAERWAPVNSPRHLDGVWLSSRHEALLVVQTRAGGFDPVAQRAAIGGIQKAFASLPGAADARLDISGPGYFSVVTSAQTRRQADWMGLCSGLGFALLLLLAYRRWSPLLLAVLPMASGALAGLLVLSCWFASVHGITLAFGITLLGVAQEYPLRLLSHRRPGEDAVVTIRRLWPLLLTAILSASIAYAAFYATRVQGLMQLAVFTVTALLVAGACTRWWLPHLLPPVARDSATTPGLSALRRRLDQLPRPRWLAGVVALASILVIGLAPGPFWQNDLSALTPIAPALLQKDAYLRHELGVADVRYLLVIPGPGLQQVLARSEQLEAPLQQLQARGALAGLNLPSFYLPSEASQRRRQRQLPDAATLRASLAAAVQGLPFRAGLFQPFLDDVAQARILPPLTAQQIESLPLGQALTGLLVQQDGQWLGLATVAEVHDPQAIRRLLLRAETPAYLLDLKATTESLVESYRYRMLWALGMAGLLLVVTVVVALGSLRRAWRVLLPMTLATLLVLAVERGCGLPLSLFHLIALVLAAGLGLHYALFFEQDSDDPAERLRILHATVVCVISALLVFGLLALSAIPVLRAIGMTVGLGVAFHFTLSALLAHRQTGPESSV
ncbi:MMPL family transporter [Frateuria aurantia]